METAVEYIRSFIKGDELQACIVAIALVIATAVVAHVVTRFIKRLSQRDGSPLPASSILVNIARTIVWVVGLSLTLSACFGVDVNALLAALGVGGLAISLGLQDTLKNLIGGLQVTFMGIVHPGDHIIVGGVEGIVQDVSWRQTVVKDYEGTVHLIPNATINTTTVQKIEPENTVITAISFVNDGREIDALVHEMELAARRAVSKVAELERDPWILLTQIGEYGIWGKMRFVLKDAEHAREARDAALRSVAPYTRIDAASILHDDGADD